MFSATTKEAANATVSDAKTTAASARRDLNNLEDEASSDFARAANKAGRKVRGLLDQANDQLHTTTDAVTAEIRSNPIRSTAIALGIGFILGAVFRR